MKRLAFLLSVLAAPAFAADVPIHADLKEVVPRGCATKMGDVTVDIADAISQNKETMSEVLLITIPKQLWNKSSEKLSSEVGTRLYARTARSDPFKALVVKSTAQDVTVSVRGTFFGYAFMDVFGISLQKGYATQSPYTPSWSMARQSETIEGNTLDLEFRMKAAKFLKCVSDNEDAD